MQEYCIRLSAPILSFQINIMIWDAHHNKINGEYKCSHEMSVPWQLESREETVKAIYRFCASIATLDEPVLICGETGTGKDVVAREIHRVSGVRGRFVPLNVGGLDEQLLSDTLFGHRRGAFTGAGEQRSGLVAEAAEGTLFLDEIGDLDAAGQIKLLRLVENNEYYPLGSDTPEICHARIILATNQNLHDLMQERTFRSDFYYRISTYEVQLLPLRDRPLDIIPLFMRFVGKAAENYGVSLSCEESWLAPLLRYHYSGNIRELRSIAHRCVHLARSCGASAIDSAVIEEVLSRCRGTGTDPAPIDSNGTIIFPSTLPSLRVWIDALICEALRRSGDNVSVAARSIGLTPQALHQRLQRRREDYLLANPIKPRT